MDLLTVQETARLLRVSPVTVRRYIKSGRLKAVRIGRNVRIEREAVEKVPAVDVPIIQELARRDARKRRLTKNDPFLKLIGLGQSAEPDDVASKKHEYLAEAFGDLHASDKH